MVFHETISHGVRSSSFEKSYCYHIYDERYLSNEHRMLSNIVNLKYKVVKGIITSYKFSYFVREVYKRECARATQLAGL